jgi:hypothetical protein
VRTFDRCPFLGTHNNYTSECRLSTGHIVGLDSEHQRPDAANYVIFECRALSGYEHAKTVVSRVTNEPLFAAAQNAGEKMAVV